MNNLFFTESHEQLKENLIEFLKKNIDPIKDSINANNKVPISLIQEIGKKGYIGPLIHAKYNGT